jgi:hypothetical protein
VNRRRISIAALITSTILLGLGTVASAETEISPSIAAACIDSDGDGEADATDRCADTTPGASVDADGCSLEQFCNAVSASTREARRLCTLADWGNDEPVMSARERDCRFERSRETGLMLCVPTTPDSTSSGWRRYPFASPESVETPCTGDRFIKYSMTYSKWVGVSLCSATRYKIFLGDDPSSSFYEIGDYAGHGQDHCELVNPAFRIPNEDDVTSGGCVTCDIDSEHVFEPPVGSQGWSRAVFGEPFEFEASWPEFNLYTAHWYECGVRIP